MSTFTPRYNIYADDNGAATHKSNDGKNRLVIAAGSPVSRAEAERLKLPELETLAAQKAAKRVEDNLLQPAQISAADAKALEKSTITPPAEPVVEVPTEPTKLGGKK